MNPTAPVKRSPVLPSNWQHYIDLLDRERVPEKARLYYVRHVEQLITAFPGRRSMHPRSGCLCGTVHGNRAWRPGSFSNRLDALYLLLIKLNHHAEARKAISGTKRLS